MTLFSDTSDTFRTDLDYDYISTCRILNYPRLRQLFIVLFERLFSATGLNQIDKKKMSVNCSIGQDL